MKEILYRVSKKTLRYLNRDFVVQTLTKPVSTIESKTILELKQWYLKIRDMLIKGFRPKSTSAGLTDQYHIGLPENIGANWQALPNKNPRLLKLVPPNKRVYDFDFYSSHGTSFQLPKGRLRQFLNGRTVGQVVVPFGDFGTKIALGMELTGKPVEEVEYNYHIKGSYRGYHETHIFDITDKHLIVKTTRGQETSGDLGNNNLYDNGTSFYQVRGSNGYFTFNQYHPAMLTGLGHDDYHRGHWLRGFHFIGSNNVFILNIHEPFLISGWVANDTWGDFMYLEGENNLLIINIYPRAYLKVTTKLSLFNVGNWDKNTLIVNCFGDGYISGNYKNDADSFREYYRGVWSNIMGG